jgi:hypothetical protein
MNGDHIIVIDSRPRLESGSNFSRSVIAANQARRRELLQLLGRLPSIAELAKTLAQGKTYQAYIPAEILERFSFGTARFGVRHDTGLFAANILDSDTGKIVQNVSLTEVPPDVLNLLNQLAMQQMLAEIGQRLEVMDEKISDLLHGQKTDRLADVESGIDLFEQAFAAADAETPSGRLISAIQSLNDGRNRLLQGTDVDFIDSLPKTQLGMLFSRRNIPAYVLAKAEAALKTIHAIVKASQYLVRAYTLLDEPASLQVSLRQSEPELRHFAEKAGQIANWLSPTHAWRESFLEIAERSLPDAAQLDIAQRLEVVEFSGQELLPPEAA